jgi:phosphoribosylaminoimidazole-succinocarboxamide synthase
MRDGIKKVDFIHLPLLVEGKVRNVYEEGDSLVMITTDRISAFDVVFDAIIPDKGKVLTGISEFWFHYTKDIVPNHLISTKLEDFPEGIQAHGDKVDGRIMLVKKMKMIDVECIVRGYLEGSGLKEYNEHGKICGISLPKGLKQGDKLPEPIFTPSLKVHDGHDENVSFQVLVQRIGEDLANQLKEISIALYQKASHYAMEKGIILADTKFEFGFFDSKLMLGDELFTPDSSRFWSLEEYQPGRPQKSFDKQYLRDYLSKIDWDKNPPAPDLPEDVIQHTRAKYIEAYEQLTGRKF